MTAVINGGGQADIALHGRRGGRVMTYIMAAGKAARYHQDRRDEQPAVIKEV